MKPLGGICGILLAGLALSGCAGRTPLPDSQVRQMKTGWFRSEPTVRSWKYLRDRNVVLQQYDYSCGASALATLMRYYFEDPVSEEQILMSILGPMPDREVREREKNGLSLLDLKQCAESRGYQAAAVKLTWQALKQLKGPVLVYVVREGYKHFAVLKGVRGDRIYLADPSLGNVRMSVARFAREWSGVALILGKEGFGLPQSYPLALDQKDFGQNEMEDARRSLFPK